MARSEDVVEMVTTEFGWFEEEEEGYAEKYRGAVDSLKIENGVLRRYLTYFAALTRPDNIVLIRGGTNWRASSLPLSARVS